MIGSHLSVAGGLHNALLKAEELGCETLAIFTKNQQQWLTRPLDPEEVTLFKHHLARLQFTSTVAHDSYLINLAAADETLRHKSIAAFTEEMRRCDQLGLTYLVTHPGAHCGQGQPCGLAKVVDALREIMKTQAHGNVIVCLETTAGQGTCLGSRFEEIAEILAQVDPPERFGVCLDTCHTLAAGYDITTPEATARVLAEFDRIIGLPRLKVLHLNDSKKPLGSRVDRHEHIGRGFVGLPAFRLLCTDPRFAALPKILETPKNGTAPDGREWDAVNLEVLRKLARGAKVVLPRWPTEAAPPAKPQAKSP